VRFYSTVTGTALAIPAVPVAVRIFMDLGQLNSLVGKTVIAAALWDDLLSLFLLAALLAVIGENSSSVAGSAIVLLLIGKVLVSFSCHNSSRNLCLPAAWEISEKPALSRSGGQHAAHRRARIRSCVSNTDSAAGAFTLCHIDWR
jgi:hypothetical protein